MSPPSPIPTLKKLGLAESEISLYLALAKYGALTAREITELTHLKRPTAYYALGQLEQKGLVHTTGHRGVERFQAEEPKVLLTLLRLRRQELDALESEVTDVLPLLASSKEQHDTRPHVSFHEGLTAVKQAIMESLLCRGKHIDSIAPSDNFFWQVSQSFSAQYIAERKKAGITTRNLWERPLQPEIMVRSFKGVSQMRILPAVMHGSFRTTIFLYDDVTMYISSAKAAYALVVHSKEHRETMQALYDGLWGASVDITNRPAANAASRR